MIFSNSGCYFLQQPVLQHCLPLQQAFGCALTVEAPGGSLTRVLWSAIPGKNYQVQYKTNLNNATWANLAGVITATNSTGAVTDDQAGQSARRFYRVLLVQ